jgi:hypothetical protein
MDDAAGSARLAPPKTKDGEGTLRSVVASLAALAILATLYGALESQRHPTLRLAGAIFLAFAGAGVVLLMRFDTRASRSPTADPFDEAGAAIRLALAMLSIDAAAIHFAVIEQHITEYWLYGAFFVIVALAQLASAVLVVRRPSVPLYLAMAYGNLLVSATWLITRTVGTLIGPDATTPEKMGFGDISSTVFQVLIAGGCVVLLRSRWPRRLVKTSRADQALILLVLVASTVSALALFSVVAGPPFVSHVG